MKSKKELIETINGWDDICKEYKLLENPETTEPEVLPYAEPKNKLQEYLNGCHISAVANYLFNGGIIPNMNDGRRKVWAWWDYSNNGFRFGDTHYGWLTGTGVGPRLCFYLDDDAEVIEWLTKLTPMYTQMFAQPKN
jgi:hypothetical protein